jgi:tetratricopeptide (TPR) repeat protein
MMNLNKKITSLLIILFTLNLSGCNQVGVKSEDTTPSATTETDLDLREIKLRADTAYENDDLETSAKDYEILIKEMPQEASHWFRLANIYVRTNRPQLAIQLYREAVIRDPEFSKAWYNLSIIQLKQTAYSLTEMLAYTKEDDPLHIKAKSMLEDIESIIKVD